MDAAKFFIFIGLGVLIAFALVDVVISAIFDRKYGPNNVLPDCVGSILIYSQDGEAYLFLDTKLSPEELSKHSSVVLKVETRNVQSAL